jgi:hypothetical protein
VGRGLLSRLEEAAMSEVPEPDLIADYVCGTVSGCPVLYHGDATSVLMALT